MPVEEFKMEVERIIESPLKFDGHVNQIVRNIDEEKRQQLLQWIRECKAGTAIPEPCRKFRHLMAFIYKSNDNMIRGILTKEKNAYFIELFLDKHKYYDRKRRYLGL